ncbi:Uncharacterized protein SVXHr_0533 [Halorhabdus sp. SVX81]|nr:Uncharacterized protein SVXHr_0533 [Halorhabdus sp. SVX81]
MFAIRRGAYIADRTGETNRVSEPVYSSVTAHARWIAVVCCLIIGVSGMAITVGAAATGDVTAAQPVAEQSPSFGTIVQQSPAGEAENGTSENRTDHHRNPTNVSGDGSPSAVKRWLAGSMARRLEGSAINLSQSNYQLASSVLGEGFGDDLDRYVNVAGDTDSPQDDQVARTFNETHQTQKQYTAQVSEFERLSAAYQAAREAGEIERARRLAKRLARLATAINETGRTLVGRYDALSNATGASLDDGRQAVLDTTNRTVADAQRVVDLSLVRTELRITSVSPTASYDEPLVITGRYVAANGTAVGDTAVALAAPGPGSQTTTAANGSFRLTHRPTDLETGVRNLTVTATPDDASVYLPATTSITADISSIEPRITFAAVFDRIAYDESRAVAVDVTVSDRPAGGVPVEITLDGTTLATGRTTESGTFQSTVGLPATVQNGTIELTAHAGAAGQALSEVSATRRVIVEPTPTTLSLDTANGSVIRVQGRLTTVDGGSVPDQPLDLSVDGVVVETVRTNASGWFAASTDGNGVAIGDAVTVTAVYDQPTTNLGPSQASAIGELTPRGLNGQEGAAGPNDSGGGLAGLPWGRLLNPIVVGAGVVSVASLLVAGYFWRRRSPTRAEPAPQSDQFETETTQSPAPTTVTLADVETVLERDGADAAVVSLYTVVGQYASADTRPDRTPRERYRAVRDTLSAEQSSTFQRVTALYEQAVFAPETVSPDRIKDTIAAVRQGFVDDGNAPADD